MYTINIFRWLKFRYQALFKVDVMNKDIVSLHAPVISVDLYCN